MVFKKKREKSTGQQNALWHLQEIPLYNKSLLLNPPEKEVQIFTHRKL
ncbi:MAG TPA: hypothetical protein VMV95_02660 [Bacillota bacterium]|nr:hypothetical protein [Bacillota bacterium]